MQFGDYIQKKIKEKEKLTQKSQKWSLFDLKLFCLNTDDAK